MSGGIKGFVRRVVDRERCEVLTSPLSPEACALRLRASLRPPDYRDGVPRGSSREEQDLAASGMLDFTRPSKVIEAAGREWGIIGWAWPSWGWLELVGRGFAERDPEPPETEMKLEIDPSGGGAAISCRSYAKPGITAAASFCVFAALSLGLLVFAQIQYGGIAVEGRPDKLGLWQLVWIPIGFLGAAALSIAWRNRRAAPHHGLLVDFVAAATDARREAPGAGQAGRLDD